MWKAGEFEGPTKAHRILLKSEIKNNWSRSYKICYVVIVKKNTVARMKVADKKNVCNQDEGIRIFFKHRQQPNEICCYISIA